MTLEGNVIMNTLTKLNTVEVYVFFGARLARFGQLGLISDHHINLQSSQNGLINHKGPGPEVIKIFHAQLG